MFVNLLVFEVVGDSHFNMTVFNSDGLQMVLPDEEPVKDDEDHLEKDVIVIDDDSSGEEDDHFLTTIVSSKFKLQFVST
ncbi:hypothetical protein L1987_08896 [Smallanthus sonchifolius]|uniref:Uncharacterized protein n=1 Tax=Smallanthus sonchifolius TaxID=185202 RepID=A0ACB9JMF5_9ASTR|nr:hypothetical protein L1987_08896 [Smallanthus sonchifolius]